MKILTEDEVIDAVILFLQKEGWAIETRCTVGQRGDDIVAVRNGDRLVIEAKGAGSSKSHTNRFGLEFTPGQVFDHVAKAVLKDLRVLGTSDARSGIALPDNEDHRREVDLILKPLSAVRVQVFFVSEQGSVRRQTTLDHEESSSQALPQIR